MTTTREIWMREMRSCSYAHFAAALAHVREVQDGASFTAMLWEDENSVSERDAAEIQRKIKRKTAEYPGFVCYCFDAFSTLIYRV